jgi:hypothetical protein
LGKRKCFVQTILRYQDFCQSGQGRAQASIEGDFLLQGHGLAVLFAGGGEVALLIEHFAQVEQHN